MGFHGYAYIYKCVFFHHLFVGSYPRNITFITVKPMGFDAFFSSGCWMVLRQGGRTVGCEHRFRIWIINAISDPSDQRLLWMVYWVGPTGERANLAAKFITIIGVYGTYSLL